MHYSPQINKERSDDDTENKNLVKKMNVTFPDLEESTHVPST